MFQERIDYIEGEIQEITRNAHNLKSDYLSLIELKLLIEKMQTFFQDHSAARKISASVQIYNNEAGKRRQMLLDSAVSLSWCDSLLCFHIQDDVTNPGIQC